MKLWTGGENESTYFVRPSWLLSNPITIVVWTLFMQSVETLESSQSKMTVAYAYIYLQIGSQQKYLFDYLLVLT